MDKILKRKEHELALLEVDQQISERKKVIAENKKLAKQMKKSEGKDWKKIIGAVRSIRPNQEAIQNLYSVNPELIESAKPKGLRRL